jgi:hypothetical protein
MLAHWGGIVAAELAGRWNLASDAAPLLPRLGSAAELNRTSGQAGRGHQVRIAVADVGDTLTQSDEDGMATFSPP